MYVRVCVCVCDTETTSQYLTTNPPLPSHTPPYNKRTAGKVIRSICTSLRASGSVASSCAQKPSSTQSKMVFMGFSVIMVIREVGLLNLRFFMIGWLIISLSTAKKCTITITIK